MWNIYVLFRLVHLVNLWKTIKRKSSNKYSNNSIDSIFFIQIRSKTLKRCIFIFFLSREFMYGKKKIEIFNLLEVHVRYLNTFKYNDSSKNKHADI